MVDSWYRALHTDLLAPGTLLRVHDALLDGPVFGYWYRAHSGGGPNQWLAESYARFEALLADAKPRDHYEIWSLPSLVVRGMALAAARYDESDTHGPSLFSDVSLRAIGEYLHDPHNEIFALFFGTPRGPDVWVDDGDDWEYVRECAEWYNLPGGQGYVFPLNVIESADYALVEAVYPG